MNFIVKRVYSGPEGTFGTMAISGKPPFCVTVERQDLGNKPSISCIPVGTYALALTPSARFDGILPEILKVPGRTAIRIHPANLASELEGCIATGESFTSINGKPGIGLSKDAFNEFMGLLRDDSATITIERCY